MQVFLDRFAETLRPDEHAVMVQGGAGWHGAGALVVPLNVTLVPLPPYSPQLNPMERVWLYLRERHLSLRLLPDTEAIVDACCEAWNALLDETGRLRSLCLQPWLRRVIQQARRYHRASGAASGTSRPSPDHASTFVPTRRRAFYSVTRRRIVYEWGRVYGLNSSQPAQVTNASIATVRIARSGFGLTRSSGNLTDGTSAGDRRR